MVAVQGMVLANNASQLTPLSTPTNQAMTASNNGTAFIFWPVTLDPITHIFLRAGTRTGTPPAYIGAIESVDTGTGSPSGTVLGGGSPASKVFTPPADSSWDNSGQWIALDNAYTPSDLVTPLAITYRHSSGTVDGSNNLSITRFFSSLGPVTQAPYNTNLTGGTWSKTTNFPCFGYKTASGVYGLPTIGGYAMNMTVNGHRQCLKWTLPTDWGTTVTVRGLSMALARHGSSNGSYRIGVWNAAGTELTSTGTLPTNVSAGPTNAGTIRIPFPTPYVFTTGVTYYLGYQNDSTQTAGIGGFRFQSAADRACLPYGTDKCLSSWNGSAWTDDDTVVPLVDIITDAIELPSGGASPRAYAFCG